MHRRAQGHAVAPAAALLAAYPVVPEPVLALRGSCVSGEEGAHPGVGLGGELGSAE